MIRLWRGPLRGRWVPERGAGMGALDNPEHVAQTAARELGLRPGTALMWRQLAQRRGQTRARVVTGWRELGEWTLLEACDRSRRRFGWPMLDLSAGEGQDDG